jgi:phosphate-selective porin
MMTRRISLCSISIAVALYAQSAHAQDGVAPVTAQPLPPTTPAPGNGPGTAPIPETPPPFTPKTDSTTSDATPPGPRLTTEDRPGKGAAVDESGTGTDTHPLAGFHNGLFFLRDVNDNAHLFIQGRAQIDFFGYAGGGVPETGLKPTLFFRRIRPEITGDFLHHFNFMIAGDFGATAIDNPKGTNETSAAAPGAAPTATSGKYASAQTTRFQAAAADVFINYREGSFFNVQVGQFDAPFMMDNRTSDKYTAFMERALPVRAIGIPSNKEMGAMAWGETSNRLFSYAVGPFNGDGMNRPNVDARFDVMGRFFVHPLATTDIAKDNPIKDLQIGGSFRYGSRDKKFVDYDYPTMTTQGAFAFWSPTYGGTNGTTHIIPAGDQIAVAGELRIPFDRFDITGELLYIKNNTREAVEGFQASNTERFGDLKGVSYYAQLGYWIYGKRDINGLPGYENPPRLNWSKADPVDPDTAVQLLVKLEQVALEYNSASRGGVVDAKNIDGNIKVNALSFGINYWATKHIRLTLDYVYNQFPDSGPTKASQPGGNVQTSTNRAQAPGNTIGAGVDDAQRDNAHDLHEVLARFAVAL